MDMLSSFNLNIMMYTVLRWKYFTYSEECALNFQS